MAQTLSDLKTAVEAKRVILNQKAHDLMTLRNQLKAAQAEWQTANIEHEKALANYIVAIEISRKKGA